MSEEAPQREHSLREVFNALRWIRASRSNLVRMMSHDLPPWFTVFQQSQRWIKAGVFEAVVSDLREILRYHDGEKSETDGSDFRFANAAIVVRIRRTGGI